MRPVGEQQNDRHGGASRECESGNRPTIGLELASIVHVRAGRVLKRVSHELCDRRVASFACRYRQQRDRASKARGSEKPGDALPWRHASPSGDNKPDDKRGGRAGPEPALLCHEGPHEDRTGRGYDCCQRDGSRTRVIEPRWDLSGHQQS